MPYRNQQGCPVCGGRFAQCRASDYSYSRCIKCRGIWIPWSVLNVMVNDMVPGERLAFGPPGVGRERHCPECRAAMTRSSLFRIPVDHCPKEEHGIWLDKDELQQILERVGDPDPGPPSPPTSFTSLLSDLFSRSAEV